MSLGPDPSLTAEENDRAEAAIVKTAEMLRRVVGTPQGRWLAFTDAELDVLQERLDSWTTPPLGGVLLCQVEMEQARRRS